MLARGSLQWNCTQKQLQDLTFRSSSVNRQHTYIHLAHTRPIVYLSGLHRVFIRGVCFSDLPATTTRKDDLCLPSRDHDGPSALDNYDRRIFAAP